jgi:hypothetical protein
MVGILPPRYFTRNTTSSGKSRGSRQIIQPQPSGERPNLCPEVLMDFTRGMQLDPGLAEGGEILAGVAAKEQLIVDELVGNELVILKELEEWHE